MHRFAHWTNLSETTFLLPPTDPAPTTGCGSSPPARSCRSPATRRSAARTRGWRPGACRGPRGEVVQQCPAGLVRVRRGERLAFAAPAGRAGGTGDGRGAGRAAARRWRVADDDVVDARWIDNGPGWVGVLLRDADAVLAVRPDWAEFGDLEVGVVGPYPAGAGVRGRGARLLPEHRGRRGPGDRQPQREHRPVAGRRPAPDVVRRVAGHRARARAAGCTSSATATRSGSAETRPRRSRGRWTCEHLRPGPRRRRQRVVLARAGRRARAARARGDRGRHRRRTTRRWGCRSTPTLVEAAIGERTDAVLVAQSLGGFTAPMVASRGRCG